MSTQGKTDTAAAPRWQRQPGERPDQILNGALTVFHKRGFAATRMDDVAQAAGISKGTIYLYFKNKKALLEALIERGMKPVAARLKAMADAAPQGDIAPILQAMMSFTAASLTNPQTSAVPLIIIKEARQFPELARLYRSTVIDIGFAAITGLIARGVKTGEFRQLNPALAARSLIAPIILQIIWHGVFEHKSDPPIDSQKLIAQHLDIFLNGAVLKG